MNTIEKVGYCVVHLALLWITIYGSLVVQTNQTTRVNLLNWIRPQGKTEIAKLFFNELKVTRFQNPKITDYHFFQNFER